MMADDAKTLVRHHTTHHFQQFGVVLGVSREVMLSFDNIIQLS